MNRANVIRFLKTRSLLVSLLTVVPLVVVVLGLAACVKHPVGDPERSKVDPSYSGVWSAQDKEGHRTLMILRPYDARTYLASIFTYQGTGASIQPDKREDFKAWLTVLGDVPFLTLEPLTCEALTGAAREPCYFVAKIRVSNSTLSLQLVNPENEPVRTANNRSELEAAITRQRAGDSLYSVTLEFQKSADKALVESVFEAFHAS